MRKGAFAIAISAACAAMACAVMSAAQAQQAAPPAIPVGVVAAERKPITKTADLVGRVESINRVQIVARVTGYLEDVLFKEGDLVKEGAPLYRIEHGLFQAAVEQAEGALERSKAAKTLSAIQLQRAQQLVANQSGTVVARDQALAADQQAEGQVLSDRAAVDTAKINLGYTDIAAPITGRIGRTNITKGNVVSPSSGSLTVLVSQDPMYITFPVSQRDILQAQKSGIQSAEIKGIKVRIRFADGSLYDQTGEINFFDVTVDKATDTVLARAGIANPKGLLIDGQLVRVVLESGTPEEKLVVPQSALIADQAGVYVFVVEDGKAAVKRVKLGGENGPDAIIEQGLSQGDQVIVEGLQGVRAGVPVRANPLPPVLRQG
jgi:membrane fusion protein, multidrug efflux system